MELTEYKKPDKAMNANILRGIQKNMVAALPFYDILTAAPNTGYCGIMWKTDMKIRTLKREDLEKLLALYAQLNEDDPAIETDVSESIWKQTIESKIINYIGLFLGNQLVSACQMLVAPNLTRGGFPYCLIENVVTHQDYRNKGYGKEVLNHTINLAWSQKCYKVMLLSGVRMNQ